MLEHAGRRWPGLAPPAPFIVAHRGASEIAPENTMPAFEAAMSDGCEVLECDVHLSRDDQVIVIHDTLLQRTTDGTGRVQEWRWRDLSRLDAGYPARFGDRFQGTRLTRLEELLEAIRGRASLMIEIKADAVGPEAGGIEERCVDAARRAGRESDVAIISMHPDAVRRIRRLAPRVTTGLVFRRHRRRGFINAAREVGAGLLIAPTATLLRNRALAGDAIDAGLRVGAYVVNGRSQLEALVSLGVESLASDRPGRMRAALARLAPGNATT